MILRCVSCSIVCVFFFFKQKTAYEVRCSDWCSDVCSSVLRARDLVGDARGVRIGAEFRAAAVRAHRGGGGRGGVYTRGAFADRRQRDPRKTLDRKSVV